MGDRLDCASICGPGLKRVEEPVQRRDWPGRAAGQASWSRRSWCAAAAVLLPCAAGLASCGDSTAGGDVAGEDVAGDGHEYAPGSSCRGVPVPCEALGPRSCSAQNGCGFSDHPPGGCVGAPPACATMTTPEDCFWIAGCDWTAEGAVDAPRCVGGGCGRVMDQTSCFARAGCAWDRTAAACVDTDEACSCSGDGPPCASQADLTSCLHHTGCVWNVAASTCVNAGRLCESNIDIDSCVLAEGCAWN